MALVFILCFVNSLQKNAHIFLITSYFEMCQEYPIESFHKNSSGYDHGQISLVCSIQKSKIQVPEQRYHQQFYTMELNHEKTLSKGTSTNKNGME